MQIDIHFALFASPPPGEIFEPERKISKANQGWELKSPERVI